MNYKETGTIYSNPLFYTQGPEAQRIPRAAASFEVLWLCKRYTTFHPHLRPILPSVPPTWEEGRTGVGNSWVEHLLFPWRQWRLSLLGDDENAAIVKCWRGDSELFSQGGWPWVTTEHPQEDAGRTPTWPDPAVNLGASELRLWTGGSCGCLCHQWGGWHWEETGNPFLTLVSQSAWS